MPCSRDADCRKGEICATEESYNNFPYCFNKCNADYDCHYPMKCKRKAKICIEYWNACEDNEMFISETKRCQCGRGLSGSNCDVKEWCKDNGKFKDCKGWNGTCEYNKSLKSIICRCFNDYKLHDKENVCKETCENGEDCKYGGICKNNFCSCKPGLIGDKCETVFDCTQKGKYKDCEKSGGKCFFDGSRAKCECSGNQKLNDKEFICETCICRGGKCVIENGKKVCQCPPGYGNFTSTSCKVCDCGPDTSCIWEAKMFGSKICLCKPGYSTKKGKCAECDCGPNSNCEWISDGWLKPEKKVCHCKPGYREDNGECVEKQDLRRFS